MSDPGEPVAVDDDTSTPDHVTRAAPLRPLVAWAWIALATVLGWPITSHVPFRNLDRSWQYAMSAIHDIEPGFGDPVVFNYGPLGFVANPMVGTGWQYIAGIVGLGVLVAGTASLLYATLRLRNVRVHAAGAATALFMLVSPNDQIVETCTIALIVYVVVRLAAGASQRAADSEWLALAVVVVALTMIKVSVGPALAVAMLVAGATAGRRALVTVVGGAAGAALIIWVGSGQSLSALDDWLGGVAQISVGHVNAMSKGDPDRNWQYVALAAISVGALLVAAPAVVKTVQGRHREGRLATLAALAIALFLAWFLFRQGFTRLASRSRLTFLAALWMLVVLMPWRQLASRRRFTGLCLAAVAAACFVNADGRGVADIFDPTRPAAEFARSGSYTLVPGRRDAVERTARDEARADYAIPQEMLDRIGTSTVHVDGTEIVATWAYELDWEPMPTLQRYLGYTADLDERNAAWLRSTDAPRFVLREFGGTIDGRFPNAESPAFNVAMFCRYEPVDSSPGWQLLELGTNRCGGPGELMSRRVTADEVVTLPGVGDDTALLIAFEPDTDIVDAVATAVFKPLDRPTMTIDGQPWRVITATVATPALVGVPEWSAWSWQVGTPPSMPGELSFDRSGRVRVLSLPVARDAS